MMKQESMGKTEHRWQMFLAFVTNAYLFFLCTTKWNAGVSISAGLVGIAVLLLYGYKKRKIQWPPKLFLIPYLIFMGSVLLASILTGDKPSIHVAQKFISYSLPFWLLYFALHEYQDDILKATLWGTIGGTWVLNIQAIHELFFQVNKDGRINASFTSANNFAMCLESILPLLWIQTWKLREQKNINKNCAICFYLSLITSLVATTALILSKSRGGIAGFIIGLFAVLVVNVLHTQPKISFKKKVVALILAACFAGCGAFAATVTFNHRSYDGERILLLKSAYAMWKDNKLYGVGFSRWNHIYRTKYILPAAKEPGLSLPHNNVANFFSCTGIIGGVGYLLFALCSVDLLLNKVRNTPANIYTKMMIWIWVAIFIHGMVDNSLYAKFNTRLYWAMWGITLASLKNR